MRLSAALIGIALSLIASDARSASAQSVPSASQADTTFAGDWGPQGLALLDAPANIEFGNVISTASGGFVLAWTSGPSPALARVLRFEANGQRSPGWPAAGLPVSTTLASQTSVRVASDGASGFFAAWTDFRDGNAVLYTQHFAADGSLAPGWPSDGRRLTPGRAQDAWMALPDESGGLYFAWSGDLAGEHKELYAYHMGANGDSVAGWPRKGVQLTFGLDDQYGSVTYDLTQILRGSRPDQVRVAYIYRPCCSAMHSCGCNLYHGLAEVGPSGILGTLLYSSPITTREEAIDLSGGRFTVFDWSPEWILEHNDGTARDWYVILPGEEHILGVDEFGSLVLRRGARIVRYAPIGVPNPLWGGVAGLDASSGYFPTFVTTDGAGGNFVGWLDARRALYASLRRFDGTLASGWTPGGMPVATRQPELSPLGALALPNQRCAFFWFDTYSYPRQLFGQAFTADRPVPVGIALVSASLEDGVVRLDWYGADPGSGGWTIDRRVREGDWSTLAEATVSGDGHVRFADSSVEPGTEYDYRLALGTEHFGTVSVTIPLAALALSRPRSNPVRDEIRFTVGLPAAGMATVTLFDVQGRRVLQRWLDSPHGGSQEVALDAHGLQSGLYLVRLSHPDGVREVRVIVAH